MKIKVKFYDLCGDEIFDETFINEQEIEIEGVFNIWRFANRESIDRITISIDKT